MRETPESQGELGDDALVFLNSTAFCPPGGKIGLRQWLGLRVLVWLGTQVGFRGRLHRLYIYPAGRLERVAFFACKGFLVRRRHPGGQEERMAFARSNVHLR